MDGLMRKVSIVGAGRVGSTLAQLLAYKNSCDVVLWNRTGDTAKGIALDLMESAPVEGFDAKIVGTGDYHDIAGSEIVVITAGAQRKEGMSRDDLLNTNAAIVKSAAEAVKQYAPSAIIIVLTNPLDPMAYVAMKASGFPKQRVVGQAGILDSSRFRAFIAMHLDVPPETVESVVLGSHGDLMVPLIGHTKVGDEPVDSLVKDTDLDKLIERTRNAGAEIIKLEKSSAFYAPASALEQMVSAILADTKEVLPCSAYLEGEYGISDVFIGVPVILGKGGVEKVAEVETSSSELAALRISADKTKDLVRVLKM